MRKGLEWQRRLRWHAGVGGLVFLAKVMSLWSVVRATKTSGSSESYGLCSKTRELVTTVWGGAFTLFVLSFDSWGKMKFVLKGNGYILERIKKVFVLFILFILNPIYMLFELVEEAVWTYHLMRRKPGFTVWSSLLSSTKNPAKIVIGCEVVITIPAMICIPDRFVDVGMPWLSEALVIGRGQEESTNTKNIRLDFDGKEVLLGLDVLPPYDELKVLQGNSGMATIISAVQSMGYIYGVVVRTIQGLPVSAIEFVGMTLSIVILIKAFIRNISSTCHRPLQVYLRQDKALTFADNCKTSGRDEISTGHKVGPMVVIVLLVSSVVIYYIVHMWQTTRIIIILTLFLTLVGLFLPILLVVVGDNIFYTFIWIMCGIVNATTYVLALVVTIKYWKVDRLNAKTSSVLAQIFPYIG